jgi:hypothetical protein
MAKEKFISPVVDVLQEIIIDQKSRDYKAGRESAFEEIKSILSNARIPDNFKTQVWYLIDEAQKVR